MAERLVLWPPTEEKTVHNAWKGLAAMGWMVALGFCALLVWQRQSPPPPPPPQAVAEEPVEMASACPDEPGVERARRLLKAGRPQAALEEVARTYHLCQEQRRQAPPELPELFAQALADLSRRQATVSATPAASTTAPPEGRRKGDDSGRQHPTNSFRPPPYLPSMMEPPGDDAPTKAGRLPEPGYPQARPHHRGMAQRYPQMPPPPQGYYDSGPICMPGGSPPPPPPGPPSTGSAPPYGPPPGYPNGGQFPGPPPGY